VEVKEVEERKKKRKNSYYCSYCFCFYPSFRYNEWGKKKKEKRGEEDRRRGEKERIKEKVVNKLK
jgi:hypothetical protein